MLGLVPGTAIVIGHRKPGATHGAAVLVAPGSCICIRLGAEQPVYTTLPQEQTAYLMLAGSALQEFSKAIQQDSFQQLFHHLLCIPRHRFWSLGSRSPVTMRPDNSGACERFTQNRPSTVQPSIWWEWVVSSELKSSFTPGMDGSDGYGARIATAGHRCDSDGCAQNIAEQKSAAMPFFTQLILRAVRHQ
jgi:hypothetical protein